MATTADIAKRYFTALAAHDPDAAIACWQPGAVDRFVEAQELVAPGDIRQYFEDLFAAFPDFSFEILDLTTFRTRSAVRWRARDLRRPRDLYGLRAQRRLDRPRGL